MTPMIIQQTAEQATLAFELQTRAEIKSIRLLKSRVASKAFKDGNAVIVGLTSASTCRARSVE
jgi:hypothetical protein